MKSNVNDQAGVNYNRAKFWQIGCFAMNNTATNLIIMAMSLVSYYATGIMGLGVVLISNALTALRVFDGFTDPIVGFFIDKTNGKFGKFRPFIIGGYTIMAICIYTMFHIPHTLPETLRFPAFLVLYIIYIIGYTAQTACTKAGQACLTNDPKQRPLFGLVDGIMTTIVMAGFSIYLSSYIVPKYGGFTLELFNEVSWTAIIAGGILTLVAVIGIWAKDRKEFFGIGEKTVKVKFKDYWPVLKNNRAIQMLIVAATTDKIGINITTNTTVILMVFAIVMGDYSISGKISSITIIPTIIFIFFGTAIARKFGLKKTLVRFTWASIVLKLPIIALFIFGNPMNIMRGFNIETMIFVGFYVLSYSTMQVTNSAVIPMIADCADYETYLTGRYVPGMLGTIFSFVDKLISSISTTIVGIAVAFVGFKEVLPSVTDTLTPGLFWVSMILYFGVPILGWFATLIAMRFYPLDSEKMLEVQEKISELKACA